MSKLTLLLAVFLFLSQGLSLPSRLRITGGDQVDIKDVPYMVSLTYFNSVCGGAIIDDMHILTAAHCVPNGDTMNLVIRVGSNYKDQGGKVVEADDIIVYPEYRWDPEDDIAVVKLTEPLEFNESIKPIALPVAGYQEEAGRVASIPGYGFDGPGSTTYTNSLQKIDITLMGTTDCKKAYIPMDLITDEMFCSRIEDQKDICLGDLGGPVVLDDKVIGIAVMERCQEKDFPNAFTRVSSYRSFIDTAIRK